MTISNVIKQMEPRTIELLKGGGYCDVNGHWMEDDLNGLAICRLCGLKAEWKLLSIGEIKK